MALDTGQGAGLDGAAWALVFWSANMAGAESEGGQNEDLR